MDDILSGQRFGRLIVLEQAEKQADGHLAYLCRCDCGKVQAIRTSRLRTGEARSCGCTRTYRARAEFDLVGKRFGRLVVTALTAKRVRRHRVWLCKCDCGATKEVPTGRLKMGLTRSCGCLANESSRKPTNERCPVPEELQLEIKGMLREFADRNRVPRESMFSLLKSLSAEWV